MKILHIVYFFWITLGIIPVLAQETDAKAYCGIYSATPSDTIKKTLEVKAQGSRIESIMYTYDTYMNPGHSNFVIGTTFLYVPVTTCEVGNNVMDCNFKIQKVYGAFGDMYVGNMVCSPEWKVFEKIDVEQYVCTIGTTLSYNSLKVTYDGVEYEKTSFVGCIEEEAPKSMMWLYITIGIVIIVLLVIAIIIVVVNKRKGKKQLPKYDCLFQN